MLPAVILVLVLVSVLAMTGLYGALNERRSSSGMVWHSQAFYVAEAGLEEKLANWPAATETLRPGDSLDLGWDEIPPRGSRYRVVIVRTDTAARRSYVVRATGQSPVGGRGGAATLAVIAGDGPPDFGLNAAVSGDGDIAKLENNSGISGLDGVPPDYAGNCPGPLEDVPGLAWPDSNGVVVEDGGEITGDPPVREWAPEDLFGMYDELAERADIELPANTTLSSLGPEMAADGSCDTSPATNWGAPTDGANPCHSHFPVIHARGDLKLEGANLPSQGVLLVDGDLKIEDNLDFHGVMMVRGDGDEITLKGENYLNVYGAVVVGGDVRFENATRVRYSSCLVRRAALAAGLFGAVRPYTFLEMF